MLTMLFETSRRAYKTAIVLMSMLFLFGSPLALAEGVSEGKVLSLSQNPSSGDLFVAYSRALYRFDTATHKRVSIPLPAEVEQLTAVVVKTGVTSMQGAEIFYLASPGVGVLVTQDEGANWQVRNKGLASKNVTALIGHAKQADTLYAVISGTGIYRSENAGNEWQLMDGGPDNMADVIVHSDMPDSMQTGWIFSATKAGVSRSMDCFCLWRETGSLSGDIAGLSYDPNQPSHIYAATDQGISRSQDGGVSWESIAAPKGVSAVFVTTSADLYAGTQSGELYIQTDEATGWELLDVL